MESGVLCSQVSIARASGTRDAGVLAFLPAHCTAHILPIEPANWNAHTLVTHPYPD